MAIEVKKKLVRATAKYEDMIVAISRIKELDVNCPFEVFVNSSGMDLRGPAKDFVLVAFFQDPAAVALLDQLNACLDIQPTDGDAYDGVQDWYTP